MKVASVFTGLAVLGYCTLTAYSFAFPIAGEPEWVSACCFALAVVIECFGIGVAWVCFSIK